MSNQISLIVGLKNNLDYTQNFYKTTREYYPDVQICFVSYGSTDGTHEWLRSLKDKNVNYSISTDNKTFSDTYNKGIEIATKEYVAFLHNDIIVGPNFLESLESDLAINRALGYTTIEPPIFEKHSRPGKIILDFGTNLENFKSQDFKTFVKQHKNKNRLEDGVTFFMCINRKVINDLGGFDNLFNPMFCEDDDLIRRIKLAGLETVTSLTAICYHFVSKTSRFSDTYRDTSREIELYSNLNYIRKWGGRTNSKTYNIGLNIKNASYDLLKGLEIYGKEIFMEDEMGLLKEQYIQDMQLRTRYKLNEKLLITPNKNVNTDIIVYLDRKTFTAEDYNNVINMNLILEDSGKVGKFKLGNLIIEVKELKNLQPDYIKVETIYN